MKNRNIQDYILLVLMEECGEVIQAASKCIRFSLYDEYNGTSNESRLSAEVNDLRAMIELANQFGIFLEKNQDAIDIKQEKVLKYFKKYEKSC